RLKKRPARAGTRAGPSRIRRRWGPSEGESDTEGKAVQIADRLARPDRIASVVAWHDDAWRQASAEVLGRADLAEVEGDRPVSVDRVEEHHRIPAQPNLHTGQRIPGQREFAVDLRCEGVLSHGLLGRSGTVGALKLGPFLDDIDHGREVDVELHRE